MPELPDIELYRVRLSERLVGQPLLRLTFHNPFVLRSFAPPASDLVGRSVVSVERLGKRLLLALEDDFFVVLHLMIAGRLRWLPEGEGERRPQGKIQLATLTFCSGAIVLQEASTRKRASIHLVRGATNLSEHRRGGLNVLEIPFETFHARATTSKRTLKRLLTDPSLFDGVGNAFSDEILFAAKLPPTRSAGTLSEAESRRLYDAIRETLTHWIDKLQADIPGFPKPAEVTAFRSEFFTHGRYGEPCRVCGNPIQRIVYAENEANYCAQCQNGGKLIADRSLSRLLKNDWPKTLEEMSGDN